MARNTTITREAVFEAADNLLASGETPTQIKVRDALGGGSFSTIGPLVREWELSRAEQSEARETAVPDAVQAVLSEVAGRLWKVASAEAALGVEAARREVEDMRRDAAAEAARASDAIQIVEGERDAAQVQVGALTTDLETVRAELVSVQTDLRSQVEARTRAEVLAEGANARADRAEADRQAVSEERSKIYAEATQLRDASIALRETVAMLTAKSAGLEDRLAAALAAVTVSDARADKAEVRAEKAEARADTLQIELTKVGADLAGVRSDLAKERAEHSATRSQLSERLERLSVELEAAKQKEERGEVSERTC